MATKATVERPRPRLSNLDELFKLDEANNQPQQPEAGPSIAIELCEQQKDTVFTVLPFDLMDDFQGHPFRLYEGERKTDMVDSIKDKGILQPLILRDKEKGRYEILSGHNRKYCGIEAGLAAAPVIVKKDLSDEEAWIYVIETNLIQRSFADMSHSEKAAVLSVRYSKLFSQGKRNDILEELKTLENLHDIKGNGTCAQVGHKLKSRDILAENYSLSKNTVARYLRIHQLVAGLKTRLDNGEILFIPAVTLSFLKEREQVLLDQCIELNSFKVDMKKADILRGYSERGKLDDETMYLIVNGELGRPPKKKRFPAFKIKPKVYSLYFAPDQKATEVEEVIEKALKFYFNHQNQSKEKKVVRNASQQDYLLDDDDHSL